MTGYNLAHMAAPDGTTVDLAKLVAGSEGSLGVVTQARLRLTRLEKHHALLVLGYPSFDAALESTEWLMTTDPGSSRNDRRDGADPREERHHLRPGAGFHRGQRR